MDGREMLGLGPGLGPSDFEVHNQARCLLHLYLLHHVPCLVYSCSAGSLLCL